MRFSFFLLPFLLIGFAFAQEKPALKMQKFYGGNGNDRAIAVEKDEDGFLYLLSTIEKGGGEINQFNGCSDVWLIKLDKNGKIIWQTTIGGSQCEEARDLWITKEGKIVIVGASNSFIEHEEKGDDNYQSDFFVCMLDKEKGQIEWVKTYGGSQQDQAFAIAPANLNQLIIAGSSYSSDFKVLSKHSGNNAWLSIINKEGKFIRGLNYGGAGNDWAYDIVTCMDKGYLFAGYSNSTDIKGKVDNSGDAWVFKTGYFGLKKWEQIIGSNGEDYYNKVIETSDSNIIAVGTYELKGKGHQFLITKFDKNGKILFNKIFGGSGFESLTSVKETSDGSYILTGYSNYYNLENDNIYGSDDFWVIRMEKNGKIRWQKTFGGNENERAYDIIEFAEDVFYVVGAKENRFNEKDKNRGEDLWLVRVDAKNCKNFAPSFTHNAKDNLAKVGQILKFKNQTPIAMSYIWFFGDGTTSKSKSPSKIYSTPGKYFVKLVAYFDKNCQKTVVLETPITVKD